MIFGLNILLNSLYKDSLKYFMMTIYYRFFGKKTEQLFIIVTIYLLIMIQEVSSNPLTEGFFKKSSTKLLFGVIGIYVSFFIASLLDEKMQSIKLFSFKTPYRSFIQPDQTHMFKYPILLVTFQNLAAYIISKLFNMFSVSQTHIPWKYSLKTGFLSVLSNICFNMGLIFTSLPLALLFRSCNLLSVIIVGVWCSKVKQDKQSNQKLGSQKIPIGIIVSIGIVMFFCGNSMNPLPMDPTMMFGILLLIICLISDGFDTDFKAEIKQKFKPTSMQMLQQITKMAFIICVFVMLITQQFIPILEFVRKCPSLMLDIISECTIHTIGLIFMFYIVANFQQHIAPLILTTRKIISAVISILVFNHQIGVIQWVGLSLVMFGTTGQFLFPSIINRMKQFKKYKQYTLI